MLEVYESMAMTPMVSAGNVVRADRWTNSLGKRMRHAIGICGVWVTSKPSRRPTPQRPELHYAQSSALEHLESVCAG